MKFKLQDVKPNPFRDLKRFPIQQAKVDALLESINTTEFWENIEGRVVEDKIEIAYGHHRVEALRQKYAPTDEFNFITRKLTDSDMIQRMARENNETYGSDLGSVIESIRATVEALSEGKVKLPEVPKDTNKQYIRYAPSFVADKRSDNLSERAYTAQTLAVFLGFTQSGGEKGQKANQKIVAALAYLENEELGIVGWNAKALDTFRKPDGSIPVDRVLTAARSAQTKQHVVLAREKEKAVVVKEAGIALQQQLREAEQERQRIAAEDEKEARRRAKDLTEKETARREQEKAEREQRKKDADEKVAAAQREWEANKAERAKQKKAEEARKARVAQDVENSRIARVRTLIEKVDRILADDGLFEELRKPPVMNPAECKLLKKALRDAGDRFDKAAGKL